MGKLANLNNVVGDGRSLETVKSRYQKGLAEFCVNRATTNRCSIVRQRIRNPSDRSASHRNTESRFVISVQGSVAVAPRKRKKRASVPFFHVARRTSNSTMSLSDGAQPRRVFFCWSCSRASFDLDEDDLQGVPAPHGTNRCAMMFADCQHIHDTHRLSTGLSVKRDELPTCARCNLANAHLRHRDIPSGGACSFLVRFFPIYQRRKLSGRRAIVG
jgi:hypothetical protein